MILHSSNSFPKILHQELINTKINNLLREIHPDFIHTNPILSGSYLIKLAVSPNSDYNDYDFYFETEQDFKKAFELLKSKYFSPKKTKNSFSFFSTSDSLSSIQLITKTFAPPADILNCHDFQNSQIAWSKDGIYFSTGFRSSWKEKTLNLSSNQLPDFSEKAQWLAKVVVLLGRINKYILRYDLNLSSQFKELLKIILQSIQTNENAFRSFDFAFLNSFDFDYHSTIQLPNKINSIFELKETILALIED